MLRSIRLSLIGRLVVFWQKILSDRDTGEILIKTNTLLDETLVKLLSNEEIKLRSAITCESKYGICAMCYGRDLARGELTLAL